MLSQNIQTIFFTTLATNNFPFWDYQSISGADPYEGLVSDLPVDIFYNKIK